MHVNTYICMCIICMLVCNFIMYMHTCMCACVCVCERGGGGRGGVEAGRGRVNFISQPGCKWSVEAAGWK